MPAKKKTPAPQNAGTKGYKAFDMQLRCKDLQYEIGKTTEFSGEIKLCECGLHFCLQCKDCFEYYLFDSTKTRVCEVSAEGIATENNEDSKRVCHKITLIREIPWAEVLTLINTGKGDTGRSNSGDSNSGHRNSGDRNSGHSNSGHWNSGHRNSGHSNSGDRNSGDSNSGHWNSGHRNSGHSNSGHRNSGDSNSGDSNSGDSNSGHSNSGHSNSGHWNSGRFHHGAFNSHDLETVMLFDKPISLLEYQQIRFPSWFYFDMCMWIQYDRMTDAEKGDHPHADICGGYVKTVPYKEAWKNAYNQASEAERQLIWAIPNFDPVVFETITGLHMEKKN